MVPYSTVPYSTVPYSTQSPRRSLRLSTHGSEVQPPTCHRNLLPAGGDDSGGASQALVFPEGCEWSLRSLVALSSSEGVLGTPSRTIVLGMP
jgi:hypothetical protein